MAAPTTFSDSTGPPSPQPLPPGLDFPYLPTLWQSFTQTPRPIYRCLLTLHNEEAAAYVGVGEVFLLASEDDLTLNSPYLRVPLLDSGRSPQATSVLN